MESIETEDPPEDPPEVLCTVFIHSIPIWSSRISIRLNHWLRTSHLKEYVRIVHDTPFKVLDETNHQVGCVYVLRGDQTGNLIQLDGLKSCRAPCWSNENDLVFAARSVADQDEVMANELQKAIQTCCLKPNLRYAVCVKDGIVCKPIEVKGIFGGLALAWALFCVNDTKIQEVWGTTNASIRTSPPNPDLSWPNVEECLNFFYIPRAEIVKKTYDLRCFIRHPTHRRRKRKPEPPQLPSSNSTSSTPSTLPSPACSVSRMGANNNYLRVSSEMAIQMRQLVRQLETGGISTAAFRHAIHDRLDKHMQDVLDLTEQERPVRRRRLAAPPSGVTLD